MMRCPGIFFTTKGHKAFLEVLGVVRSDPDKSGSTQKFENSLQKVDTTLDRATYCVMLTTNTLIIELCIIKANIRHRRIHE